MSTGIHKEQRFLDVLESLFTGADVEGNSGFINLMHIKRRYFTSLRPQLMAAIDGRAAQGSDFREELFDKLYTFFARYFCESGSVYFRHLPVLSRTYERVYAEDSDGYLDLFEQGGARRTFRYRDLTVRVGLVMFSDATRSALEAYGRFWTDSPKNFHGLFMKGRLLGRRL